MTPRLCSTCTAILGRPTRHAARRLCSSVQAQHRYRQTPEWRTANAAAQRAWRQRQRGAS